MQAADQFLTEQDWTAVDLMFAANRDPLAGTDYKASTDRLFSLIVNITPAPIGVGPEISSGAASRVRASPICSPGETGENK